jgi:GPH family glycoside/pentoside/hexuronide:cation symporter
MITKKTKTNEVRNQDRISWPVKLSYGIGQYPEGVKSSAFSIFLLFYYTMVNGLSGTLAGTALLISLIIDGISDPLMGSISDACKSRWGRRHPYMYISAVPFAACFFLLFYPPQGLGQIQLFLWLTVFSVLTRVFMTIYSVPHMSMNAELTQNYFERTLLAALRILFSNAGYLVVAAGGFILFFRSTSEYPNGQLNPAAYPFFAWVFALTMVAASFLCALGTHGEIPKLIRMQTKVAPFRLKRVFNEIKNTLGVSSFRIKIAATFLYSAMFGTMLALVIFALTYFWGLSSGQVGSVIITCVFTTIIGAVFAKPIASLIGEKRESYMIAIGWFAIWTSTSIFLRLFNLLPPNGHWIILPLVIITNAIAYLGNGVAQSVSASMIADLTDEHERVYRVRQEGIYFGAVLLMTKVSTGMGNFLAGIITDITGITEFAKTSSAANPESLFSFGMIWGPLPLVLVAIAVIIVRKYDIDQSRHTAILDEIKLWKLHQMAGALRLRIEPATISLF